jgi:hypothetical protein
MALPNPGLAAPDNLRTFCNATRSPTFPDLLTCIRLDAITSTDPPQTAQITCCLSGVAPVRVQTATITDAERLEVKYWHKHRWLTGQKHPGSCDQQQPHTGLGSQITAHPPSAPICLQSRATWPAMHLRWHALLPLGSTAALNKWLVVG